MARCSTKNCNKGAVTRVFAGCTETSQKTRPVCQACCDKHNEKQLTLTDGKLNIAT